MSNQTEDECIESAEMYDILSEQHWQARRPSVVAALHRMAIAPAGTMLDIGAGTGLGLKVVADTFRDVSIHAIEPSASMRIGLMTRVLADPDLRARVTVHPVSFKAAMLPAGVHGVLLCGCIGFFAASERATLWRRIAACLVPAGAVLADVMMVQRPEPMPQTLVATAQVGRHRYDIWLDGTPEADDVMRWRMQFAQSDEAGTLRRFTVERRWHALDLERLIAEADVAGFDAHVLDDSPVPAALLRLRARG